MDEIPETIVNPDVVQLSTGEIVRIPNHNSQADETNPDLVIDKIHNVWGSTAGAGSDFYSVYRKQKNTELERIEKLDADFLKM